MKNKILSKAYGGVTEARRKLYGLGLPRQWKVITSTLLLLFTFAIGNVLAEEVKLVAVGTTATQSSPDFFDNKTYKSADESYSVNLSTNGTSKSQGGSYDSKKDYYYALGSACDMSGTPSNYFKVSATGCKISKIVVRMHDNSTSQACFPAMGCVDGLPSTSTKSSKNGRVADVIIDNQTPSSYGSVKRFDNASTLTYTFSTNVSEVYFSKQLKGIGLASATSWSNYPSSSAQSVCVYGIDVYVVPEATADVAPEITAPTTDQSAVYTVGDAITALSVTATGTPTPTYQWYYNSSASTEGATSLGSSAQTASYTPSNAAASDLYYYCVVTNSAGSATSHYFHVTVSAPSTPTHGISYTNLKGSDVSAYPTTYYEGTGIASFAPLADVADFHFTGWDPASISDTEDQDVEVEAQWVDAYNVSFSAGAGSGTVPTTFQKWDGATFNLPGQGSMVAPSGRVFGGWKAGGTKYAASAEYTMTNAAVEFVAQWDLLVEQVLYSWEGAEGGATEVGGTATHYNADAAVDGNPRVNYKTTANSVDYYTISLNGKADYSTDHIRIALTANAKAGDKVKMTAFYSKDSEKTVAPKIANSTNAELVTGTTPPNIYSSGVPTLQTVILPVGADEAELRLTRSTTATNVFITKLQIVHEKAVPEEDIRTVTFNTNGGSAIAAVSVEKGTAVAQPADPTKAHCRFEGWQLSGSDYDFSSAVNSNITLDAVWTQLYTISFAAGDGSGDAPAAIADKAKDETFEVPANTFTAPASKEFDKWNDGSADYAPGATYTVGTANVVLTAQWKAVTAKYTVIFKDGETTLDTKLFEVGSNPSDADIDKTKPLFAFAAWQKEGVDIALDDAFWATVVKDATVTLTARWAKAYATSYDMEAYAASVGASKAGLEAALTAANYAFTNINGIDNEHTHNYTYDGMKYKTNDGDLSFNVVAGKVVEVKTGHLPSNDAVIMNINGVADATVFEGADEASETHKTNYFYSAVEALYRLDVLASKGTCAVKAVTIRDPFTVSFEAHGDADPSALQGLPSVTLPDATNGTASLLGWFDAETGGNKIGDAGATYIPTASITLHAQWESISTDARLSSISFSSAAGTLEPAFDPEVVNYTYTMPYPTAAVPTITGATSVSAKAKTPVIDAQAANWGDVAHIHGVAESDDTKDYYITMKIAPKDGVSIIKVATTGGTNKTVTGLYAGDGDVNLSSNTKMDNGKYIGFTLDGTTLQAGDRINVHTTEAGNTGGSHIIFYDNMTDKNELYDTEEIGGTGDNIFTINAAMVGKATAYVYRANNDVAHQWNGKVNFIEVTRAINPMLTAMTIDGRTVTIDEEHKTATCTIPYEADLAALTIVPTIVRNAPHATTPEAVISNAGAWIEGDNTYRVMDKDGDYTDYTITLDRDVLKHTVSFNTHGGSAVTSEEVEHNGYLAAAPTAPTKEDYLFQYWSETEDGAEVDVTTVQIDEDKTFHAVWASDGAIKLLNGATVNHTNFITGVTADETVEFKGNEVHYAAFTGTVSGVNGVKDLTRVIAYNATTNKTKIRISAHNNSTSARNILVKGLVEGASDAVDLATIALGNKEDKISDWIEFNNAANRTIYIFVPSSAGDVYFTQVKVIESGETEMKQAGEAGYALNLNKGRFFGLASTDLAFEGLNARLSGDYTALNSGYAKLTETSMSFTVAAPMLLKVTTNNNKTYYVTKDAAGTDNETAKTGVSEFNLTAGTWYITAGSSEVQFTNIAFSQPTCPEAVLPSFVGAYCEGGSIPTLDATATNDLTDYNVVYSWFAADAPETELANLATFTPTADGDYKVKVTVSKAGYLDAIVISDAITVAVTPAIAITMDNLSAHASDAVALTVNVTAGVPTAYAWYTCDDELGTNPVLIAAAEAASYNIPTPVVEQYYKVVVSGVCGGDVAAVAHVTLLPDYTRVDVTESTTWDWTKASEETTVNMPEVNVETLLANVPGIHNDANFNSQALLVTGQYAKRDGGSNIAFQGTTVRFYVTKPGKVTITARRASGSGSMDVSLNGTVVLDDLTSTKKTSKAIFVPAGWVTIEESDNNNQMRLYEIVYNATPDYTRDQMLGAGVYGTICLPNNVPAGGAFGATFYEFVGRESVHGKLVFDEIINGALEAGKPYVFQAHGDELYAFYGETHVDSPVNEGGMYGTFSDIVLSGDELDGVYYFAQKALWSCKNAETLTVAANRAYVKLAEMDYIAPTPAPGRRRISMAVNGEQVATGLENTGFESEAPRKVLINGELFIIRGEKMYDAKGQLVK